MSQTAHDTNEIPALNPNLFLPPRPRRWPIVLMTAAMLALAAMAIVFYLQARGLQETMRTTAAKLNEVEVAREEAGAKHQKNLEELQKQLSDLAAKQAAAEAAAKPTKKSAIKADNAKDDTTMVVTIADDKLGLIETCKVPAKEQSEFLRTTLRLNKGEGKVRDGRTVEDLTDLDEVFPGENWTVLGRLCHRE